MEIVGPYKNLPRVATAGKCRAGIDWSKGRLAGHSHVAADFITCLTVGKYVNYVETNIAPVW